MIARLTRLILALVAVLTVSLAALGGPAAAHSSQAGSSPEDGESVTVAPSEVEVLFDSPLLDVGAALVVRDASGTPVVVGTPRVDRQRITVDVDPAAPPGEYTVAYRVVAEDGHAIESTFGYTVAGDAPPASAPPPSSAPVEDDASPVGGDAPAAAEPASTPPYLLIAGGVLVLLLAGAGAIALRR